MYLMDTETSINKLLLIIFWTIVCVSCQPVKNEEVVAETETASRYLYVASGACYSGNNTVFSNTTSSNVIYRLNLDTGVKDITVADYFSFPSNAGDSPVGIASVDSDYIYVLVENTTTVSLRRIEKVAKTAAGSRQIVSNNITALSAQLRSLHLLSNGDFLISKSTALEYITEANARIGAPYISASAAPCNTSTTLVPKAVTLSNGKIVFLHAAAAQNRFGIYNTAGGTTCAVAQAAPTAAAFPVAAFYDAANTKLIVAYSGNAATTDLNSIYAYTINETTGAVTSPQKIYDAANYPATYSYLLYGISEMTYDVETSSVYIATAVSTATTVTNYSIEKFTYDPTMIGVTNASVLTRDGATSFYPYGTDTKCISSMMISD